VCEDVKQIGEHAQRAASLANVNVNGRAGGVVQERSRQQVVFMRVNQRLDREKLASEFLAGWTPERLFRHWLDEAAELGIVPAQLVQTIAICRSAGQLGSDEKRVEWWPKSNFEQLRRSLEAQAANSQHTETSPALDVEPAQHATPGARHTIRCLLEADGDPTRSAAVLLAASLFTRIESARARYPRDAWPPFSVAQTLLRWARAKQACQWDSACDASLPSHDSASDLIIGSVQQLVRFLAAEHARVLHRWTPVQIVVADEVSPRSTSFTSGVYAALQANSHWPSQRPPEEPWRTVLHSQRVVIDPARAQQERWQTLSREELEALIWSKPQGELAKDLGVSDAALSKRCKTLGISKPGRGFWRKAQNAAAKPAAERTRRRSPRAS
jgi:hypothetical protein